MLFEGIVSVECRLVALRDIVVRVCSRCETNGGYEEESLPSVGFVEVFRCSEDVVGYGDDCEVACDTVEESDGVNAGREESRNTNEREGGGKEGEIPTEMTKKTEYSTICSVSVDAPVPVPHSPQEKAEAFQGEQSYGVEGRR